MKRTFWWLFLLLVLAGCQTQNIPQVVPPEQPASSAAVAATDKIRIATFNIQNFGLTKAGKPAVMQVLATIIRKYDVVAVQEVSDVTEKAPYKLLDAVNASGSAYALLLSERTGKQPDDHSSQEQYALFYNTKTVHARDPGTLYPDDAHDYFQREPFVAGFERKNSTFRFVLVTIHTMPERAFAEIASLKEVVVWVKTRYPGENDFILLGDFNAGCSYVSGTQLEQLRTNELPYLWIVPDSSDSNVSPKTACPYDRIISAMGLMPNYTGNWGVDRAYTDTAVSDHWPVWAEFSFKVVQ